MVTLIYIVYEFLPLFDFSISQHLCHFILESSFTCTNSICNVNSFNIGAIINHRVAFPVCLPVHLLAIHIVYIGYICFENVGPTVLADGCIMHCLQSSCYFKIYLYTSMFLICITKKNYFCNFLFACLREETQIRVFS